VVVVELPVVAVSQSAVYTVLALAVTRLKSIYNKNTDLCHIEYLCHIPGIYTIAASQPPAYLNRKRMSILIIHPAKVAYNAPSPLLEIK